MVLYGKKGVQVNIKCNGDVLHGLFRYRLPDFLVIAPEYMKSCELLEGELGAVGSIYYWNYVLDGRKQVIKHNIETVDENNKLITFNALDGDLLKFYKSIKAHLQIDGTVDNSTVTWTFEYEKMTEDIPDPDSLVTAVQDITKYVEARLNPDLLAELKIPQLQ